jgi:hypothetical protein
VRQSYDWTASLTNDAANPLIIKQSEPVKIKFVADVTRSAAKKTLEIDGTLLLEAPGSTSMLISSASVSRMLAIVCISIHTLGVPAGALVVLQF